MLKLYILVFIAASELYAHIVSSWIYLFVYFFTMCFSIVYGAKVMTILVIIIVPQQLFGY